MKRFATVAAFALACLSAGPAAAHWENTRWGMSEAELKSEYPDVSFRNSLMGYRLSRPVTHLGVTWPEVYFRFGTRPGAGLYIVSLQGGDVDPRTLDAVVRARCVPPIEARSEIARGKRYTPVCRDGGGDWYELEILWLEVSSHPVCSLQVTQHDRRAVPPASTPPAGPPAPGSGWENTRWGMTRSQVHALFPAAIEDGTTLKLSRTTSWMGATWRSVRFVFDPNGTLLRVELETATEDYSAVEAAMRARFGSPIYIGPHSLNFRVQRGGDIVQIGVPPGLFMPPDGGTVATIKPGTPVPGSPGQ